MKLCGYYNLQNNYSFQAFPSIIKDLLKPNIYRMVIFIPITVYFKSSDFSAPLVFFSSALFISPIARLISFSIENLAGYRT
jgi:hypothetical protein